MDMPWQKHRHPGSRSLLGRGVDHLERGTRLGFVDAADEYHAAAAVDRGFDRVEHQPQRKGHDQRGEAKLPGLEDADEAVILDRLQGSELRRPEAKRYPVPYGGVIERAVGIDEVRGRSTDPQNFLAVARDFHRIA